MTNIMTIYRSDSTTTLRAIGRIWPRRPEEFPLPSRQCKGAYQCSRYDEFQRIWLIILRIQQI